MPNERISMSKLKQLLGLQASNLSVRVRIPAMKGRRSGPCRSSIPADAGPRVTRFMDCRSELSTGQMFFDLEAFADLLPTVLCRRMDSPLSISR